MREEYVRTSPSDGDPPSEEEEVQGWDLSDVGCPLSLAAAEVPYEVPFAAF